MHHRNRVRGYIGLGVLALVWAGCRPVLPEAGVPASVYAQERLTLGTNVLGEWFVVVPKSLKLDMDEVRYVLVDHKGERKLFYARAYGPRSIEVLPLSPVSDWWLREAGASKTTSIQFPASVAGIKSLTDPIGWSDEKGRVRWLHRRANTMRPGRYVGTLWRGELPEDRDEWTLDAVIQQDFELRVEQPVRSSVVLKRLHDASTTLKSSGFVVVGAQVPRAPRTIAVSGIDMSSFDIAEESRVTLKAAAPFPKSTNAQRGYGWAFELLSGGDTASLHLRREGGAFSIWPLRAWRAPARVDQMRLPSLWRHPVTFEKAPVSKVVFGYDAALSGLPLVALRTMDGLSGRVGAEETMPWRVLELYGQAQRMPWMRKALRQGKTHWQASDRVYTAMAYLVDGSPVSAEVEARAAIMGFAPWPFKARQVGRARAYGVLLHAYGGQGRWQDALKAARKSVKFYIAQKDDLHAAQVEWDAARIAFKGNLPDEALAFARRARSRFYYGGAPLACAQVELLLAQMYLSLGQLTQARRLADFAVARLKYLKHPVGINRARVVSLLIDDRLDPIRNPSFGLEEAFEAATVLQDPKGQAMAAAGLIDHRSVTPPKKLAQYLEILAKTAGHGMLDMQRAQRLRALYTSCLSVLNDQVSDSTDPKSVKNAGSREWAGVCDWANGVVPTDEALVRLWVRRIRMGVLAGQKKSSTALADMLVKRLAKAPALLKSNPELVALAYATASGVLPNSDALRKQAVSSIDATVDPLRRSFVYADVARRLESTPWAEASSLMWKRALVAAAKAKQFDLWSTLIVEWAMSDERASPKSLRTSTAWAVKAPQGLNPRDRVMHSARVRAVRGQSVQLPSNGVLSAQDHIEVHVLRAHRAAKQQNRTQVRALLMKISQLERGLSRRLLQTPRVQLLRGRAMVLDAQLLWHDGRYTQAWSRAYDAVKLLVESDTPVAVRARVDAVVLMGLGAQGKRERVIVDRELSKLTASDRRSGHRLHEVLGWRARALIDYDRGEMRRSIMAMKRLVAMGYAVTPYGDVYDCGQAQSRFGVLGDAGALDDVRVCLNTKNQPALVSRMALFEAIRTPTSNMTATVERLNAFGAKPANSTVAAYTRAQASWIASQLVDAGPVDAAKVQQLKRAFARAAARSEKIRVMHELCAYLVSHRQFDDVAPLLLAYQKLSLKTGSPEHIDYLTVLARYHNQHLTSQRVLFFNLKRLDPGKGEKAPKIKQTPTLIKKKMALRRELVFSALLNGQRQLAQTHLRVIVAYANTLRDASAAQEAKTMGTQLGLLRP